MSAEFISHELHNEVDTTGSDGYYEPVIPSGVLQEQNAYTLWKVRREGVQTDHGVSPVYLDALSSLDPTSSEFPDLPDIESQGEIDTRLAFQTAMNYLLVRSLERRTNEHERDTLNHLRDVTENTDEVDATVFAKNLIRSHFPQEDIDHLMPDGLEKLDLEAKLTPPETIALAKTLLRHDTSSRDARLSESIMEEAYYRGLPSLNGHESGRYHEKTAIKKLIHHVSQGEDAALEYMDTHTEEAQRLISYFDKNRETLAVAYLEALRVLPDVESLHDLPTDIRAITLDASDELRQDMRETTQLMSERLAPLLIPLGMNCRVTVSEYLDSEQALADALDLRTFQEEAVPLLSEPIITERPRVPIEDRISGLAQATQQAIDIHLMTGFKRYNHVQFERAFGLSRGEGWRVLKKNIVSPNRRNNLRGDNHPRFSPEEAVVAKAITDLGYTLSSQERKEVRNYIAKKYRERMEEENRNNSSGK